MEIENNVNLQKNEMNDIEIDNIINEYKNQLREIKTRKKNSPKNSPKKEEKLSISPNSTSPSSNNDLQKELQSDNIRLQSQLAFAKSQINFLNQTITKQEKEIEDLKLEIQKKEKEFNEKIQKNFEDNSSNQRNLEEITNEKFEYEKIILNFFNFFNNNLELFSKTDLITIGNSARINFETKNCKKNAESANFAIVTIESFIKKLMNDNTEMYNELIKFKSQPNLIENLNSQNLKDLKLENNLLKQQINGLIEKLNNANNTLESNDKGEKKVKKKFLKKRCGSCAKINCSNVSKLANKTTSNFSIRNDVNTSMNNTHSSLNSKIDMEPMKKLKMKIRDLENRIKGDNFGAVNNSNMVNSANSVDDENE